MSPPAPYNAERADYILSTAPELAAALLPASPVVGQTIGLIACEVAGAIYDIATAGSLDPTMEQAPQPDAAQPFGVHVIRDTMKEVLAKIRASIDLTRQPDPNCDCPACELRRAIASAAKPATPQQGTTGGN